MVLLKPYRMKSNKIESRNRFYLLIRFDQYIIFAEFGSVVTYLSRGLI